MPGLASLEALLTADTEWTSTHGVTEVLNFRVPGFGTDQELLALKRYGLSYQDLGRSRQPVLGDPFSHPHERTDR
jgi:hypothetical protein